jgi:hypothetical protein
MAEKSSILKPFTKASTALAGVAKDFKETVAEGLTSVADGIKGGAEGLAAAVTHQKGRRTESASDLGSEWVRGNRRAVEQDADAQASLRRARRAVSLSLDLHEHAATVKGVKVMLSRVALLSWSLSYVGDTVWRPTVGPKVGGGTWFASY